MSPSSPFWDERAPRGRPAVAEGLAGKLRQEWADQGTTEVAMRAKDREALAEVLRRHREALFRAVAEGEAEFLGMTDSREAELEERAQEDRVARLVAGLDERGKREIEAIDAALERLAVGTYGVCGDCEEEIPLARLQAIPEAALCVDCAERQEKGTLAPVEVETPTEAPLPADMVLLSDPEFENALRDLVREDGRVDLEELRIVARHGVVHLQGFIPSEAERQILRKLLTDVAGVRELVDRLEVNELLWEREDRSRRVPATLLERHSEPALTEDLAESLEDGLEYMAPGEPIADEG